MEKENIIYEGFFLHDTDVKGTLVKDVLHKHITTEFRPVNTHKHLYGAYASFTVTGYGNDGENEGYSVEMVECDNEELLDIYKNIKIPHVTLSTGKKGKPVDTANLEFTECQPLYITGRFGGFTGGGEVVYE